MAMLQLDEVREVLERTERLAVRSAFALCLAFEMMQRSPDNPKLMIPDLEALRSEIDRVSDALCEILSERERARGDEMVEVPRLH
jgi:hypothetical protein